MVIEGKFIGSLVINVIMNDVGVNWGIMGLKNNFKIVKIVINVMV